MYRNRVKRTLREAFWSLAERGLPADHDFVLVARPDVAELVDREGGVERGLRELFADAGLGEPRLNRRLGPYNVKRWRPSRSRRSTSTGA